MILALMYIVLISLSREKENIDVYMAKTAFSLEYRTQPCGEGFWIDGATVYSHINRNEDYDTAVGHLFINCKQTFQSRANKRKLKLKIDYLDIKDVTAGMCKDSLKIYNSHDVNDSASLVSENGLCGTYMKNNNTFDVLVSDSGKFTIVFTTDGGTRGGRGFRLVLSAFHRGINGKCESDEFRCRNEDCIHQDLICDGIDHCFDNSDELLYEYKKCKREAPLLFRILWKLQTPRSMLFIFSLFGFFVAMVVLLFFFRCAKSLRCLRSSAAKAPKYQTFETPDRRRIGGYDNENLCMTSPRSTCQTLTTVNRTGQSVKTIVTEKRNDENVV